MKCPKCGKETLVLYRGKPHGLSHEELKRAQKEIKSGKIYGFRCLTCGYQIRFGKPKTRQEFLKWLHKEMKQK